MIPYKDGIIIQVSSSKWGKDHSTGSDTWLRDYQTFNNVTVQGSNFKFGKYGGMFAAYKGKITNAILLKGDPTSGTIY